MRDGHFSLFPCLPAKAPYHEAIDSNEAIVDRHTEVSIESGLEVEHHVDGRHDDADHPQPDAGLILQVEIDQSDDKSEYI